MKGLTVGKGKLTMAPRLRVCPQCLHALSKAQKIHFLQPRHASTAAAITPAAPLDQMTISRPPLARFPSTQPPSHKPPEYRKSQLHRQYTSLLRSTPLILIFQHSNLRSTEWMSIRRELVSALRKIDEQESLTLAAPPPQADAIKLQIIRASIFSSALLVADYFDPAAYPSAPVPRSTDPSTQSSAELPNQIPDPNSATYTHGLSSTAHAATRRHRYSHPLSPLLSGPLAVLTFPTVSPAHLAAALSILSPKAPQFPAPKRKTNPGLYEPSVQVGLQKLLLLGARIEGRVFDGEGVRWVGGLEGGMGGLRAQLVGMLGGVGAGVTGALESASRSLYLTMEGSRGMLEDEGKAKDGQGAHTGDGS